MKIFRLNALIITLGRFMSNGTSVIKDIRLKIWPLASRLSRLLKVIGTDTDRSATYDFLLTFHSNHEPISYPFRDKRRFQSKIAKSPVYFAPLLKRIIGYWCSSSSSSSAPISEHSRLRKLTPLWTILRTLPRCVETKVMGPKVELYCVNTEPCLLWSTCPASPICWRTIIMMDAKNAQVVLWWVGSRKMSEQTKSSLCDNCGDWGLTCSTPHFFVVDMRRT